MITLCQRTQLHRTFQIYFNLVALATTLTVIAHIVPLVLFVWVWHLPAFTLIVVYVCWILAFRLCMRITYILLLYKAGLTAAPRDFRWWLSWCVGSIVCVLLTYHTDNFYVTILYSVFSATLLIKRLSELGAQISAQAAYALYEDS